MTYPAIKNEYTGHDLWKPVLPLLTLNTIVGINKMHKLGDNTSEPVNPETYKNQTVLNWLINNYKCKHYSSYYL